MSDPTLHCAIFGGGQLARMLALAGHNLGIQVRCIDPFSTVPVEGIADSLQGDWGDEQQVAAWVAGADAATWEVERVPLEGMEYAQASTPVFPAPDTIKQVRDRADQKASLDRLHIPTAAWSAPEGKAAVQDYLSTQNYPLMIKARLGGFDGRGVALCHNATEALEACAEFGWNNVIIEAGIEFDEESSVLIARGRDGAMVTYPMVYNHTVDGMLAYSEAPHPTLSSTMVAKATAIARTIAEGINYVGLLAVECFRCGDEWLVNELAPRVHNTGHWTIEGAQCSQFENHLRAVLGLPLGDASARGYSAMFNLVGEKPDFHSILAVPGSHVHWYNKAPRTKRKLGHVTITAQTRDELNQRIAQMRPLIPIQ